LEQDKLYKRGGKKGMQLNVLKRVDLGGKKGVRQKNPASKNKSSTLSAASFAGSMVNDFSSLRVTSPFNGWAGL
jgi:hypothetical protein